MFSQKADAANLYDAYKLTLLSKKYTNASLGTIFFNSSSSSSASCMEDKREHSAVLQESKAQKLLFECLHLKNYIIGYPEKKVHPDFSNLLWKRKLVRKIGSSKTRRWHEITLDLRSIVL